MTKKLTFLIAAAVMLLTMIVSPVKAVGQTKGSVTFTFSDHYSSNTVLDATAISLDASIQATFNKRNGGTATQYYTNGNAVRWYGGGTLLIEAKTGSNATITNITINYTQTANSVSASVGTYSLSNNVGTWTGSASAVTFTQSGTTGQCRISAISVTYSTGGSTAVATPTITPNSGSFLTSQEVSISCATTGATIYYTTDGSAPSTTSTQYTTPFTIDETTTVKAYAVLTNYDDSQVASATFTKATALTVAEAIAATPATGTSDYVYISGIVSAFYNTSIMGDGSNYRYYISDDGTTTNQLLVYKGNGLNNVAFANVNDLLVNDQVIIYGKLTTYNSTKEVAAGNYIYSLERPTVTVEAPTFSPAAGTYDEAQSVTLSCATDGATIYYTTDGTNPTNESTQYASAINIASTTTIKAIAYVGEDYSTVTTATYTIVSINNISDITEVGTAYSVKGTVVAINSRGFVMGDGTGYVYYYKGEDTGKSVGNKIKVTGTTGTYGQIIQFTNTATVSEATSSSYNNTPAATVITAVPDYSTGYHLSTYLEFTGALEKSSSNYFITVGEGQIQISYPTSAQSTALTALNGKTVHVKGYFSGINSSSKFTVMLESAEEVAVPSITLTPSVINEAPAAGGSGEITVTCTNMGENPVLSIEFCDANGDPAEYDWISAEFNNTYTKITGTFAENTTTEPRTAHLRVYGTVSNSKTTVYSDIFSITQLAPAEPSIVFTTTTYNPGANGESKTLSFNYEGLGDSPEFTVRFYDVTGETQTTYGWVSGEIIQGDNKVTIIVDANEGEARSAYFKVYGEKNENVHAESNLVTITQAAYVVDYATLPFSWAGNTSAPTGITNNGVGTYSSSPYLKFDGTGDYIILKINERPGTLTFDIKGNSFSDGTFKVQTSENGETYTDLETYTELGSTQSESFNSLGENIRYIKWIYTEKVNGNVALGNIALAKYVAPVPSITAEDVNIAYDATEGSITYTINNPVEGGTMGSMPISGGDWLTVGGPSNGSVALTCEQNTGAERTATVRLTYTYNNTKEAVTEDVTVTQAGVPATMYVVNFNLDDGTFVPNDDFPQDVVEKEAGTYTLPSATKAGFDFTGWNDGTDTYEAGAEYTVSSDVDFTAQWTESTTGTIAFGSASGSTPINSTSVTGDDSMGNTWTITTEGTSSFTQNAAYSQVGSGSSPATSITFTMTLPQQKIISAFEAKFGGFNGTVGDIALTVGNTTVGSGSLNGSTDVIVEATTTTEVGTVLTVTVTNIDKGVKCYYISYTLSDAPVVPVIDATAGSALAYNATAGSIIYEIANYEVGTMTATTTADWINALVVTTPTAEDGEVTFNVTENTSNESRSATVTLSFTYGNPAATVTKDVTVTQNGTPSITVTPATANVAFAGGAPDFAVTYESLEITKADDFDVEFYETSTSTIAGNQPSWITNVAITGNTTDGFTLTTTVAANDGAARNAYLKVYALDENTEPVYSGLVTISQAEHTQLATYSLVTSVDDIVSGKHYIIASSATDGDAYAMGGQTSNNRSGVAVTIDNSQITETDDVYEFVINTHETSSKDVVYTIYDAATPGYLYAASSSKNYLRTKTTLDDNGKWTIAIAAAGSAASVVAQGSYTHNIMKFNSSDNIFSCYASGQSPIYLYVKDNDVNFEYYGGEVAYPENSIPDGGSITVSAGSVLTVPTGFTNNDPNAFIIQDGGQVIYNGTGTFNATLQNNVTAYSNDPGVSDGWYLIASPVDGLSTDVVAQGTYDLFVYNEPNAYWWVASGHGITEFARGKGYLYANSANQLLAYAGTMGATNENIEKQLSYTSTLGDDVRGFNLVGNPFTRNLVLGNMKLGENTLTHFYVMNAQRTGLTSIDNDSYEIKPGEGFFVQAIAENQTLEFNPTSKGLEDIKFIKIVAGNENGTDNAYINIGCGNTLRKMNIADLTNVYVMNEDKDFAAARIEELAGTMPVNFEAVEDGEYTITVEAKFIEAHSMHLIDNFTGADIDLMVEPSYTFNATANDNAERFTLVFDFNNYTGCNENYTSENFIYQNGDEIIVNGEGELQVFDVLGRFVMSQNVSGVERISKPAQTGVYIFMMNGNAQKIVVK